MSLYFSKTTGGFYIPEIHGDGIPDDAVEITHEAHAELMAEQATGKVIIGDADGLPQAVEPSAPVVTWDSIRSKRDGLLAASDWTQLADSPLTAEKKSAWATYRQALRDITEAASTAAVIWPTAPAK